MMKAEKLIWIAACALAVSGCAAFFQSTVSLRDIEVKPVESIQHAGYTPRIMYLLGRYYQGKAHYQKAIDAYQKTLAAQPNYVEAHNGLGMIYGTLGQFDLADEHFSTAIELAPMASYLHNNLGYALLIQGREHEAADAFKKALAIDPENERAHLNLTRAYNRLGLEDTLEDVLAVQRLKPESKDAQSAPAAVDKEAETAATGPRLVKIAPNIYEYREVEQRSIPQSVVSVETAADIPIPRNKNAPKQFPERVEVSNGNGVTGMAGQVSRFLNQYGLNRIRLTNHQSFQQTETEIHYRNGRLQHSKQLAQLLPKPVKFVESRALRHDVQIKILLGQDLSSELTFFADNTVDPSEKLSTKVIARQSN